MTRSEILALSQMTEVEQDAWLDKHHLLEKTTQDMVNYYYESLADLADRLWREALENHAPDLDIEMAQIARENGKRAWVDFFAYHALPIHRIQAALLAKEFQK